MTSVTFVLVSLFIAIGGLALVNIANRREARSRVIAKRVANIKRQIQDLEELSVSLEPLLESAKIPSIINEEIIDSINGVIHFGADAQVLDIYRENAASRKEMLSQAGNKAPLYRAQESDAKMARALYQLNETSEILRTRQAKGALEAGEMEALLGELSWAHLMVKVVTHVIEGQKAHQSGNLARALAFYKKAQQIVMETGVSDGRRQPLIKEIGLLLNNKHEDFSSELIPEFSRNAAASPGEPFAMPTTEEAPETPSDNDNHEP